VTTLAGGRTLLDELVRSGVALRPVPADLAAQRASVLADLTRAPRALVSRATADASRARLREDAARAEGALADVEDAIARNDPTSAPAQVAELREIQAALAEDEALLSFQLWRVVVAVGVFAVRRARRAHPAFHGRPEARSLQV